MSADAGALANFSILGFVLILYGQAGPERSKKAKRAAALQHHRAEATLNKAALAQATSSLPKVGMPKTFHSLNVNKPERVRQGVGGGGFNERAIPQPTKHTADDEYDRLSRRVRRGAEAGASEANAAPEPTAELTATKPLIAARKASLGSQLRIHHRGAIGCNSSLGGRRAGVNNAKDVLLGICHEALRRGVNVSHETLRWNSRPDKRKQGATVPHNELWNISSWNSYVDRHGGLPYLVKGAPQTTVGCSLFTNVLFMNTYANPGWQDPAHALVVAHFHRALVPHDRLRQMINTMAPPKPYGALHPRLEDDLRQYATFMKHRISARQVFDAMAASSPLGVCAEGINDLFVAVGDVSDKADAALLSAGHGPFGTRLAFRGADTSLLVGAIVDMAIAADATYYVGYGDKSTFDRAIFDLRSLREYYKAGPLVPAKCTYTLEAEMWPGNADCNLPKWEKHTKQQKRKLKTCKVIQAHVRDVKYMIHPA